MSRGKHPQAPPPGPLRAVMARARAEAESAGHGFVGLEHLLIVLAEPAAPATARVLSEHGFEATRAREAVRLVVGSGCGDGPSRDPRSLLSALGIDLQRVRDMVEKVYGPGAMEGLTRTSRTRGPLCDLGLSPPLKRAAHVALTSFPTEPLLDLHERLLLSGLESGSPGLIAVLDQLGVPAEALQARLAVRLRRAG